MSVKLYTRDDHLTNKLMRLVTAANVAAAMLVITLPEKLRSVRLLYGVKYPAGMTAIEFASKYRSLMSVGMLMQSITVSERPEHERVGKIVTQFALLQAACGVVVGVVVVEVVVVVVIVGVVSA